MQGPDSSEPPTEEPQPRGYSHSTPPRRSVFDEPAAEPEQPPPAAAVTPPVRDESAGGPALPPVDPDRVDSFDTTQPTPPASDTWYRSDQQRYRSVHRRANPWYRRLARGLIGLALLAVVGVGLYYGAQALQDWLDRDKLPAPGVDVPTVRATSIQVRSSAPAPEVDGTITIDTVTRAFEFVGSAGGPQAGWQVTSPDGNQVFSRESGGTWQLTSGEDRRVIDLRRAIDYVIDDTTADAILTNRLRRGYVELISKTKEGVDDDELTRYELELNTRLFSVDFPLQWGSYRDDAIPGIQEAPAVPVTIWLDDEQVLVRVNDEQTNWAWQRLSYNDEAFVPIDPSGTLVDAATGLLPCQPETGLEFRTAFDTCAQAIDLGRTLAESNGLVTDANLESADAAFTTVCRAIQSTDAPDTELTPASIELAEELHATGVCPGELGLLSGS